MPKAKTYNFISLFVVLRLLYKPEKYVTTESGMTLLILYYIFSTSHIFFLSTGFSKWRTFTFKYVDPHVCI